MLADPFPSGKVRILNDAANSYDCRKRCWILIQPGELPIFNRENSEPVCRGPLVGTSHVAGGKGAVNISKGGYAAQERATLGIATLG